MSVHVTDDLDNKSNFMAGAVRVQTNLPGTPAACTTLKNKNA